MKHLQTLFALAVFSFLLLACSHENDSIDEGMRLTAPLFLTANDQIPNEVFDKAENGIYFGVIASRLDQSRGKIWENVEREIRTMEVSELVSFVATISSVRRKLVEQQQRMGQGKGVVMDGRDIGTVVFLDAELKIFMNPSAEKRARRRFDELVNRGDIVTYDEVLENVLERDHIDTTCEDSPLIKADDAIEIDNSDMNIEDQFHIVLQLAQDRIAGRV